MCYINTLDNIELNYQYQNCSVLDITGNIKHHRNMTAKLEPLEHGDIIAALTPVLERATPNEDTCNFFSKYCRTNPRSRIVTELLPSVILKILKTAADFGKTPYLRSLVQEYIEAMDCQTEDTFDVGKFTQSIHGPMSICPHPQVLSNLVAVCIDAICRLFEERKTMFREATILDITYDERNESQFHCYLGILEKISTYEDWRPFYGGLLQPIPFPKSAKAYDLFTGKMKRVIKNLADDKRCEVHSSVLGIREGKEGWFDIYRPGNIACDDDGELWGIMLNSLISCCCKKRRFLSDLKDNIGPIMLMAVGENEAAMDAICAMLEYGIIADTDVKRKLVTVLQTALRGKQKYYELCERQMALKDIQQKGGPKRLSVPSKSTDSDLSTILRSGSLGDLEYLNLAFTKVTSECAKELIKLPSLKYLNLWCTQFGDAGIDLISEHLPDLKYLNLCETPVTDRGVQSLAALKNLKKLNLNSTNLSALGYSQLKASLPNLTECDVRYTDAWGHFQ